MAQRKQPPELTFQQHVADYLVREHKYGRLEQADITDPEHCIDEDLLWSFLKASQTDTLSKALGTSLEFWYGMQVNYDLWQAKKKFRGKCSPSRSVRAPRPDGSANCRDRARILAARDNPRFCRANRESENRDGFAVDSPHRHRTEDSRRE